MLRQLSSENAYFNNTNVTVGRLGKREHWNLLLFSMVHMDFTAIHGNHQLIVHSVREVTFASSVAIAERTSTEMVCRSLMDPSIRYVDSMCGRRNKWSRPLTSMERNFFILGIHSHILTSHANSIQLLSHYNSYQSFLPCLLCYPKLSQEEVLACDNAFLSTTLGPLFKLRRCRSFRPHTQWKSTSPERIATQSRFE